MAQRPVYNNTPAYDETAALNTPTLGQKCAAEFLGTAFLVFIGAGAATASGFLLGKSFTLEAANLISIALGFGFALMAMVYAIGHISGCHINPAVTIALALNGRLPWSEAGAYIVVQLIGGIVGAFIIALAFPTASHTVAGFGATNFNTRDTNYFVASVLEAIATFFLTFVIMGTVIDKRAPRGVAGLAIGMTLAGAILFIGSVTGGSLNPARSIGPAVAQWITGGYYPALHLIVYIIGPIVGGIVGVYAYEYMARTRVAEQGTHHPAMESTR